MSCSTTALNQFKHTSAARIPIIKHLEIEFYSKRELMSTSTLHNKDVVKSVQRQPTAINIKKTRHLTTIGTEYYAEQGILKREVSLYL